MSPRDGAADVSAFSAVDQSADPAAMIAMLDSFQPLHGRAKSVLLERLRPQTARTALDVGCGPGDDLLEMAGRMPPGAAAQGVDASEVMLAEARRRAAAAGVEVTFRVGDALSLPYPDAVFDVCRVKTVLQHVTDPLRAVREMVRVTRPGGRVGAMEIDLGTVVLDHPDQHLTQTVLDAFRESAAQPWMGRQLQRLFREAGLTGVTVDPIAFLAGYDVFAVLFRPAIARLRDQQVLTAGQESQWWSWLSRQQKAGGVLGGATVFVVTGSREPGPPARPPGRGGG
jgi:ubiquinone/menaquinone biosynthesis C-methylase UbiE